MASQNGGETVKCVNKTQKLKSYKFILLSKMTNLNMKWIPKSKFCPALCLAVL